MLCEKHLKIFPLCRMDYKSAMARQLEMVERCIGSEGAENFLMQVEHPPVITLGRSAEREDMRTSTTLLRRRGIEVAETNRGGKITYHGPGQLVVYPIIHLRHRGRDLHRYLRELEAWVMELLAAWGIAAQTNPPHTGVWVDGAKIASIGIAVRRWVAYHGVALNVTTDMDCFDHIVPCGLEDAEMVSMASLIRRNLQLHEVASEAAGSFRKCFDFP